MLALNLVGGTLNLASNTANNYSGGTTLSGGVLVPKVPVPMALTPSAVERTRTPPLSVVPPRSATT